MHYKSGREHQGFTLVEVLVVIGIIALVSAIAIPGLARLGAFSRDEFKRTVSQVDSLLRAAQVYSTTYRVDTALVYSLDNWSALDASSGTPSALTNPIVDSYTGEVVRQIEAAAIMYRLPSTMGSIRDTFVPIPGATGEFQSFPSGMAIMLQHPLRETATGYVNYYPETTTNNYDPLAADNRIGGFGMTSVAATLGLPVNVSSAELLAFIETTPAPYTVAQFPAHVFRSNGRMDMPERYDEECGTCAAVTIDPDCVLCDGERFTMYIAPSADRPLDVRLNNPESSDRIDYDLSGNSDLDQSNLLYRRIFLHRSTARVSVPDDF